MLPSNNVVDHHGHQKPRKLRLLVACLAPVQYRRGCICKLVELETNVLNGKTQTLVGGGGDLGSGSGADDRSLQTFINCLANRLSLSLWLTQRKPLGSHNSNSRRWR